MLPLREDSIVKLQIHFVTENNKLAISEMEVGAAKLGDDTFLGRAEGAFTVISTVESTLGSLSEVIDKLAKVSHNLTGCFNSDFMFRCILLWTFHG